MPWQEFSYGKRFHIKFQLLGKFGGGSQISVAMELLPPGKQANQPHYHLLEEEYVFVLEGSMIVRLGDHSHIAGPGTYACFPAEQKVAHALYNHTQADCRYLIFGNPHKHDVAMFPETSRVHVRLTGESYHATPTMDYWEGIADRGSRDAGGEPR